MIDKMTRQKAEEIAAAMRAAMRRNDDEYPDGEFLSDMSDYIKDLEALFRPSLADMTYEERKECRWMQADDGPTGERVVVLNPLWTKAIARVLRGTGQVSEVRSDTLTPRPDLPRLEWPGNKEIGDVTALKVGDVIESAVEPRIYTLPEGSILLDCDGETVAKRGDVWEGEGYIPYPDEGTDFGPWTVLHVGQEVDQ